MTDIEKVIKGLEECAGTGNCQNCVYKNEPPTLSCKALLKDTLELIKSAKLIHTEHATYTVYEPTGENND